MEELDRHMLELLIVEFWGSVAELVPRMIPFCNMLDSNNISIDHYMPYSTYATEYRCAYY